MEKNAALAAQLALLKQLYEEGLLDQAAYRQKLAAFNGSGENLYVKGGGVPGTKRTAFEQREQEVTNQTNVAGNQININLSPDDKESCLSLADAFSCYLNYVIESHRKLKLQGIRSAGGLVSIELEEIYVTLTATLRQSVQVEDDEASWLEEPEAVVFTEEGGNLERVQRREIVQQVKVAVQKALKLHSHLVVLGDPGSGKTTLLRYLALTYARDLLLLLDGETGPGMVLHRLGLSECLFPILLPLRDFARYLEKQHPDIGADGPKLLLNYLHIYFENQEIMLPPNFFSILLKRRVCVVLLDGVDEVASMPLRQRVARIIERFTHAYPNNRYVVTSRIVGYTAGARLGGDFAVTTVRDFSDDDIKRFVEHWNRSIEAVLAGESSSYALHQAKEQTESLLEAIRHNERVRELAVNPLLLTVIALVHRYRAQLPARRVELYEEAIEVLLVQWDAVKGLPSTDVLQGLKLDAGDRRSLLEPVALWMMEQRLKEIELDDLRRLLAKPFYGLLKDQRLAQKAVNGFVHLINARSGLLSERGMGIYAFSHLTFQEHLAARAVADRADYVDYTLQRLGDSWWREVVLLEAGYLSTQGKRRSTELIRAIMECVEESEPYHNLVLAAEALRDVGAARSEGDVADVVQRRLREAFEKPLCKGDDLKATIRRRSAAAEALAKVESGMFGTQPAFWTQPWGVPVFVEIPAGEFWMGSENGKGDEKPRHKVHLERYWIARTPLSNAQYRIFVGDSEYRDSRYWQGGRVSKGLESHPVVYASWHDAQAYCRWLEEKLREPGGKLVILREGRPVPFDADLTAIRCSLPSEAQWEKAARGAADQREYPWGEEWQEGYCNTGELEVKGTTPVGIFPEGSSPYGCLDMAGNVWEWTRSLYGTYPYDATDGREAATKFCVLRGVRGGSWDINQMCVRCAYRYWYDPDYFDDDFGFRVVFSLG